jgi:hypothetical protein
MLAPAAYAMTSDARGGRSFRRRRSALWHGDCAALGVMPKHLKIKSNPAILIVSDVREG